MRRLLLILALISTQASAWSNPPLYRYVPDFVQPQAQPTPYVYQQPAYQAPAQQYNNTYHDTYEYHYSAPAQTMPQYDTFAAPDLDSGF